MTIGEVSYLRAAVSCLPVIGSISSVIGISKLKYELDCMPLKRAALQVQRAGAAASSQDLQVKAAEATEALKALPKRQHQIYRQMLTFQITGLIASVLSLAGVVSLVALGILFAATPFVGWGLVAVLAAVTVVQIVSTCLQARRLKEFEAKHRQQQAQII